MLERRRLTLKKTVSIREFFPATESHNLSDPKIDRRRENLQPILDDIVDVGEESVETA